jgi:hypothetical protein
MTKHTHEVPAGMWDVNKRTFYCIGCDKRIPEDQIEDQLETKRHRLKGANRD